MYKEFFIMANECELIKIKQMLTDKQIPYKIKTTNNTLRMSTPLNTLFYRNRKNYYSIFVKEEYAQQARKIIEG